MALSRGVIKGFGIGLTSFGAGMITAIVLISFLELPPSMGYPTYLVASTLAIVVFVLGLFYVGATEFVIEHPKKAESTTDPAGRPMPVVPRSYQFPTVEDIEAGAAPPRN